MKIFYTKSTFTLDVYQLIKARTKENAREIAKDNAFDASINLENSRFYNSVVTYFDDNPDESVDAKVITKDDLLKDYKKKFVDDLEVLINEKS